VADEPARWNGLLGRLERKTGPFFRSPGIAFPYIVGFLRRNGLLTDDDRVVVQHDKIEGPTPFEEILEEKADLSRGDCDVLFITAYTNSAREAYRRAREARAAYAARGRRLIVALGGPHASALPEEATRWGHLDTTVPGEGEWAAAELLDDVRQGKPIKPVYRTPFARIRDRGTLSLDMGIWKGLKRPPQQVLASTHFARGCKLDCHFCGVFLTNGPTVRNRDVQDIVDEINAQGPAFTRETIDQMGPGTFNTILRALVRIPGVGRLWGDKLIAQMGPGFTHRFFFWDDNLYNAAGPFQALCDAIRPLNRPWSAELTIDLAEKPELLRAAYESGCRDLFMGAFVFGLDGDDASSFDKTLEFIYETGIDYVVANIIQPYPGTGTFKDAVVNDTFLPWAKCPEDSDVMMDYNWPLFDGAHVIVQPRGMTPEELQNGYYYFLREA
jgi:radical SAM superfamily enzyme YgiQ (UPF0313 family)